MRIIPGCEKCLYDRQVTVAQGIAGEAAREQYVTEIQEILDNRKEKDCAP